MPGNGKSLPFYHLSCMLPGVSSVSLLAAGRRATRGNWTLPAREEAMRVASIEPKAFSY
jgi:hypothetical protein